MLAIFAQFPPPTHPYPQKTNPTNKKTPPNKKKTKLNVLTRKIPNDTEVNRFYSITKNVMLYPCYMPEQVDLDLLHGINFRLKGKLGLISLFCISYKVTLFYGIHIW